MKTIQLSGSARQNVGKRDAKDLRNEAKVPCILYGAGVDQVKFWAHAYDLKQILYTPDTYLVTVKVDDKAYKAIVQESQFHPVNDAIMHVDFLAVNENSPVKIALPIHFVGTSPGVKAGGKLVQKIRKMKVKGLLNDMPAQLDVDITNLELGKNIRVKELGYANLTILEAPNNPVCEVAIPRGLRNQA